MSKFYTPEVHANMTHKYDMLKGCINRMFVTDSPNEIEDLLKNAILDLTDIYNANHERVLEQRYGDKETRAENHRKNLENMFR